MGNDLMRQLIPYFAREIIPVTYLPDESDEMAVGMFLTDEFPTPEFAFFHQRRWALA